MAKKEKAPAPAPAEETKVEAESPEAPAPAPKGGGKMKLIIIAALAMAIGIGGAVAAMKFMGGSAAPTEVEEVAEPTGDPDSPPPIEAPRRAGAESPPPPAHGAGPAEGDPAAAEALGPVNIEFKPFIVNLNDAGGKRFLKLTMSIEAENEALAGEINAKMPQFRDIILLLLSSLSYDDIATLDGKMRLRNQMLNRINTQLGSGKIKNIYFSEFVVQ